MIYHSLICLLNENKNTNVKTLKLSSQPDEKKLYEIYEYNIQALQNISKFCIEKNIKSLRVSSNLFPLSNHISYKEKSKKIINKICKSFDFSLINSLELSFHPDQFILLSSLNENVNQNSIDDLEFYSYLKNYLNIKLVNIHCGTKANGFNEHKNIIINNFNKLSDETKKLISFENDERSFSFDETLIIAQETQSMIVPDFHHNRCYNRRINDFQNIYEYDDQIYDKINLVFQTYSGKNALPTFHISSPKFGWNKNFKEECSHNDYILKEDYPNKLASIAKDKNIILDIEAKMKELAIEKLNKELNII